MPTDWDLYDVPVFGSGGAVFSIDSVAIEDTFDEVCSDELEELSHLCLFMARDCPVLMLGAVTMTDPARIRWYMLRLEEFERDPKLALCHEKHRFEDVESTSFKEIAQLVGADKA